MIFAKRYKDVIPQNQFEDDFCGKADIDTKDKIVDLMEKYSEPIIEHPDRYNTSFTHTTDAFQKACHDFNDMMSSAFFKCMDFDNFRSLKATVRCGRMAYIYSIIELQYQLLSDTERIPFSRELNALLADLEIPWRILEGQMIKLDAKQFECDLRAKALAQMHELKDAEPKFQSAYTELASAIEALEKGDYQATISNAGKSYESVLKVILSADRGNADKLTNEYMNQFLTVPDTMKVEGFREKVMMSLPYVRNNSGADHGAGAQEVVISKPMAKLAVNLAAALDTYLIEEYAARMTETEKSAE